MFKRFSSVFLRLLVVVTANTIGIVYAIFYLPRYTHYKNVFILLVSVHDFQKTVQQCKESVCKKSLLNLKEDPKILFIVR